MAQISLKTLGGSDLNFRPTRGCGTVVQNSGSHDAIGPKIYGEITPNYEKFVDLLQHKLRLVPQILTLFGHFYHFVMCDLSILKISNKII